MELFIVTYLGGVL